MGGALRNLLTFYGVHGERVRVAAASAGLDRIDGAEVSPPYTNTPHPGCWSPT